MYCADTVLFFPDEVQSDTCFFNGDKRRHHFGTEWHPYVPYFGFMTCAVCRCAVSHLVTVILLLHEFLWENLSNALSDHPIYTEVSVMTIEHMKVSNNTMHCLLEITPGFSRKDFP